MNKVCIECGAQLQDSWQHCINCGTKVIKVSEGKDENIVHEPTKAPLEEIDSISPKATGTDTNSKKTPIFIVVGIMLIAIVVIFATKDNSNKGYESNGVYQSTDTTQPLPSDAAANSDILSRLNSGSSIEWIEDPGNLFTQPEVAKHIEGVYLTYDCGVWVLNDENSAKSLSSTFTDKDFWSFEDRISGKFILVTTDTATDSTTRPCVKAAGLTFGYNFTN